MAVLPSAAFRSALTDLSPAERARFVADLARARGRTARIEDGDEPVVCIARGDRDRRLLIHDPGWRSVFRTIPDGIDAVVTPGAGRPRGVGDVEVVDGDVLYERAVYGIGADDRERLFRDHLGRPAIVPGAGSAGPDGDGDRSLRRLHAVIGLVALVVVAAALVGGVPGASDDSGTQRAVDGGAGASTPTPFAGAGTVPSTTSTATSTPFPELSPAPADAYPPGVNESGIVDPDALLAAHTEAVAGSPHRLVLTYTEFDDLGRTGQRRLVASVDRRDRLRASVSDSGAGVGIADPVPRWEAYADGATLYRRFPRYNGTLYRRDGGPTVPANVVVFGRSYLDRTLRIDSSRLAGTTVRNGTRLFEIVVTGDDDPRTADVRGRLVVDDRGIVRSFRRQYAANATGKLSATVSLRYEFARVTADPPPWLSRARAALGENVSAFVPASNRTTAAENASTTGGEALSPALSRRPAGS